jgi:hypothetical protein
VRPINLCIDLKYSYYIQSQSTSCANTHPIELQIIFSQTSDSSAAPATAAVDRLLMDQQPESGFGVL